MSIQGCKNESLKWWRVGFFSSDRSDSWLYKCGYVKRAVGVLGSSKNFLVWYRCSFYFPEEKSYYGEKYNLVQLHFSFGLSFSIHFLQHFYFLPLITQIYLFNQFWWFSSPKPLDWLRAVITQSKKLAFQGVKWLSITIIHTYFVYKCFSENCCIFHIIEVLKDVFWQKKHTLIFTL